MKTIKNMLFMVTLLVAICGILVGCVEEDMSSVVADAENEKSLVDSDVESANSLPLSIQDGIVSEEMYNETMRYFKESTPYFESISAHKRAIMADASVLKDENFKSNVKTDLDEFDVFIKGFSFNPKTDADFEINKLISEVLYYLELYNSDFRSGVQEASQYSFDSAQKNINTVNTSATALANTLTKYGLNQQ